jgi:PAS domain S-box-containing protein
MEMDTAQPQTIEKSRSLLDTIQVAFLLTDSHAKILHANHHAESLFGYKTAEMLGQRLRVLFLEDDLIYFLPNIIYLTLYKDGFDGEALLRRKDGTRLFVRLFSTSFKEEGETFLTFSIQEIQRLKKLERERLESERWESLGRMVEEIAHQVRNPVVSIGGYTKRLQKVLPSSPKGQSYLDQIVHETTRLETMIRRLEEYVHIPKPVYGRENMHEVVETALQFFFKEATDHGISMTVETKGVHENGYLFIDRELVTRAFSQVIKNSLEAMILESVGKQRRVINVAVFGDSEHLGIAVFDKGQGISKKNVGLVCEPFFSTRPDHVGLGLTLVRRVMGEHGGIVQIESKLRQSTTVTLLFPRDRRRKIRRELLSPEAASTRD